MSKATFAKCALGTPASSSSVGAYCAVLNLSGILRQLNKGILKPKVGSAAIADLREQTLDGSFDSQCCLSGYSKKRQLRRIRCGPGKELTHGCPLAVHIAAHTGSVLFAVWRDQCQSARAVRSSLWQAVENCRTSWERSRDERSERLERFLAPRREGHALPIPLVGHVSTCGPREGQCLQARRRIPAGAAQQDRPQLSAAPIATPRSTASFH